MPEALIITSPSAMSAPLPDTPFLQLRGERIVLTSDGFSGAAANFGGRITDAALGGARVPWKLAGPADSWRTNGTGRLALGASTSGTFFAYLPLGTAAANRDVELSLRIMELPTANLSLDLFRDSEGSTDSQKMRLTIAPNGSATFVYSAPTDSAPISGTGFTVAPGDTISFRYNTKTNAYAFRSNGVIGREGTWTPPRPLSGTMFGIAGTTNMTAGALDDFKLTETII